MKHGTNAQWQADEIAKAEERDAAILNASPVFKARKRERSYLLRSVAPYVGLAVLAIVAAAAIYTQFP